MRPIFKFLRNALCHSFCISPTHFRMCCQEVFSPMSFSSNSGNRRQHNTFRHSDVQYDGWRRNAKRQENKKKKGKNPPLISAKCVSVTARFKLMGLILSAPKNSPYNTNFQCHWICLSVRRRRAGCGWRWQMVLTLLLNVGSDRRCPLLLALSLCSVCWLVARRRVKLQERSISCSSLECFCFLFSLSSRLRGNYRTFHFMR